MPRLIPHIARLPLAERTAVGALRGTLPEKFGSADRGCFSRLREVAQAQGMRVLSKDVPYVSDDELRLLGELALKQRTRSSLGNASTVLDELITMCAALLCAQRLILGPRSLVWVDGLNLTQESRASEPPTSFHNAEDVGTVFKPPSEGSLMGRALRIVHHRGRMHTSQLAQVGVSRAVVSIMFKRRMLVRVQAGVYQLSAQAAAWVDGG